MSPAAVMEKIVFFTRAYSPAKIASGIILPKPYI